MVPKRLVICIGCPWPSYIVICVSESTAVPFLGVINKGRGFWNFSWKKGCGCHVFKWLIRCFQVGDGMKTDEKPANIDSILDLPKETIIANVSQSGHFITIKPEPQCSPVLLPCATCPQKFSSEIDLENHIRIAHGNCDLFRCAKCERSFYTQEHLDRHLTQHTRVKPFICSTCQKSFFQKHHLEAHVNSVHKKLKPYSCPICNQCFAAKQKIGPHIDAVHKKLKLFSCELCMKSFAYSSTLRSHLKIVHNGHT